MACTRVTRHHPTGGSRSESAKEDATPLLSVFHASGASASSAPSQEQPGDIELLLSSSLSRPPDERLAGIRRSVHISQEAPLTPQFVQELAHALRLQSWHIDGHLQVRSGPPRE